MNSCVSTNETESLNTTVMNLAVSNFDRDVSEGLVETHEKDALLYLYIEEAKKLVAAGA